MDNETANWVVPIGGSIVVFVWLFLLLALA